MKSAQAELSTVSQKIGEALYAQPDAGAAPAADAGTSGAEGSAPADDDVVDAEIVDEEDAK